MSYHNSKTAGAAPVSRVEVIDAQSLFLITALRLASRGTDCKAADSWAALWDGLALNVGAERASEAHKAFEGLMTLFVRHGRRPLMTHDGSCSCIGADEAVFAQFVCLAADGEPEDAMLMGMLLLRADIVPLAVGVAQQLGLLTRAIFDLGNTARMPPEHRAYH
jgi:hypothetical protein